MYLFITIEVKHGNMTHDLHRVFSTNFSGVEAATWEYMRENFRGYRTFLRNLGEMCDPEGIWWKYLGDGFIPEEFTARVKTIREIPKEQFSMLYQLFEGE
jgi:hypothetical protein